MHYRRLGRSGLKVSEISFGAWVTLGEQIDEKTANDLIHSAAVFIQLQAGKDNLSCPKTSSL